MPLTPRYSLSQDASSVVLTVVVPYVRVGDAEVVVDGPSVHFFCSPYLLRLTLPGDLVDDEAHPVHAAYDADAGHGTLTITLAKAVAGAMFPDLDLVTEAPSLLPPMVQPHAGPTPPSSSNTLMGEGGDGLMAQLSRLSLAPEGKSGAGAVPPLIEVLHSTTTVDGSQDAEIAGASTLPGGSSLLAPPSYGFNRAFFGVFAPLRADLGAVVSLPDPDHTPPRARPLLRALAEETAWGDGSRYAGDAAEGEDDPLYLTAMGCEPWWVTGGAPVELTPEEGEALARLPKRDVLMDGASVFSPRTLPPLSFNGDGDASRPEAARTLAALLPILAGYAYDWRLTEGESTVESGWTVAVLSPLLAWLDDEMILPPEEGVEPAPPSPRDRLRAGCVHFVRRVLTQPYLRRWDLAVLALNDASVLLRGGRRTVLRALLAVRGSVKGGGAAGEEGAYLLNTLVLDGYCSWVTSPGGLSEEEAVAGGVAVGEIVAGMTREEPELAHWRLTALESMHRMDEGEEGDEGEEEESDSDDSDSEIE